MKTNYKFLAIIGINLLITFVYLKNVECFSVPFFKEVKEKLTNKFNTSESYSTKSQKSKNVGDESSQTFKTNLWENFERFSNPFSRDFPPNFKRNYSYFLLVFLLLLCYGVAGYHRNKKLARGWCSEALPVLLDNFAYIERDPSPLNVKGWNEFDMYASGRTSCKGFHLDFELIKRQCFWHEHLVRLIYPQQDTVTFEVQFETLDHVLFAVCRKLKNKCFVSKFPHLILFSNLYESKDLPDLFRGYLNSNDKTVVQLANYVLHHFNPFIKNLEYLYLSDIVTLESSVVTRPFLTCRFALTKEPKEFENLVTSVVKVADYLKNFSLTPKLRDSVLKERSEMEVVFRRLNKGSREEVNEEDPQLSMEKVKKMKEKISRKGKGMGGIRIKVS